MRLSDITGRGAEPLPAEVEAELEALDAALAGEGVRPGDEGLATLAADVRAQRPDPDPEFGAKLDAWAAAGFPRGHRPGPGTAADAGAGRRRSILDALTPRRLAYAGGAAAALVVVAVGISQVDFGDGRSDGDAPVGIQASEEGESFGTTQAEPATPDDSGPAPGDVLDESATGVEPQTGYDRAVAPRTVPPPPGDDRAAGGQDVRRVDRDAQLTLAAPVDEVQDVTNEAIGVVNAHRGVVLNSRSTGTEESAQATLQLVIPTRNLDAALDELSGLADVKQLSEGSQDITRPFVDARDKLAGLRAERQSLLSQIEVADTEEELDDLRVRLDSVQRRIARADAEFDNIKRRARQSNVYLQITSEGASSGDWSLEDALDDAGRVLTVGAGIALISAAVLLPLAIVAAIAYFTISAAKRRSRERALDD